MTSGQASDNYRQKENYFTTVAVDDWFRLPVARRCRIELVFCGIVDKVALRVI